MNTIKTIVNKETIIITEATVIATRKWNIDKIANDIKFALCSDSFAMDKYEYVQNCLNAIKNFESGKNDNDIRFVVKALEFQTGNVFKLNQIRILSNKK